MLPPDTPAAEYRRPTAAHKIWRAITEPLMHIPDPSERQQARLLAALLFVLLHLDLALMLTLRLVPQLQLGTLALMLMLVGFILVLVCYGISRTRLFRWAAALIVISASLLAWIGATAPETSRALYATTFFILPMLLSGVLLPLSFTTGLIVVQTLALLLIPALRPGEGLENEAARAVVLHLLAGALVLMVTLYNRTIQHLRHKHLRQREAELQAGYDRLEARISERTAELSALNARLRQQIAEREQAEQALTEERNLLRTLIENLPDMIFVLDRDSRYLLDNAAHRRIIGAASAAEVIGRGAEHFFPAQQAAQFRAEEQQIMASGQPMLNVEEGYPDRITGAITYHLLSKIPFRDASGAVIGLIGISRNITELKQVQRALEQANSSLERRVEIRTLELFKANMRLKAEIEERQRAEAAERQQRLLAEALRDTAAAINTLEPDEVFNRIFTHIVHVVPCDSANISLIENGIARVVRYWSAKEQTTAQTDILTSGFAVDETPTLRRMRDTGQPVLIEDTHTYPDWVVIKNTNWFGSYIGVPVRIDGEVIGFLNANAYQPYTLKPEHVERMAAFTEQVAVAIRNARLYEAVRRSADELAERVIERTAELEEQRAQLEAILDAISDGVVSSSVSDDGMIQPGYVNRALSELLGYSLTDWYPNLIQEAIISDDAPEQLYQQVLVDLLQRGRWSGEVRLRRKDGSIFNAYIETIRISSGDRLLSGVVTVVRDISQQKALEEQKSRFVANASHELRTPITNLITRLWLLRRQPEKLDEHLDILDDVANRIRRLVIDLLDLSRFERGQIPLQREAMDIVPVIRSVVNLQRPEAERKRVRLLAELPEKPLIVFGDPERIHQVITNLVTNAIHYTPEGGQVRVYTTGTLHPDDKLIAIHVEDSGVGIAPEHVPNLFQPFYRAGAQHSGGTGLGLTIAREIIMQHDGDILVNSQPGAGSTFTVRLRLIE